MYNHSDMSDVLRSWYCTELIVSRDSTTKERSIEREIKSSAYSCLTTSDMSI